MIDIDFETRSKIDIKMGPWRYAADPSTSILCMAYKIEDGPVNLWLPGMPRPDFVTKEFWNFFTVVAHNVGFEKAVWREICVKRYGWPDIPDEVWQCSAAKCAAHALPRDLKRACIAMNTDIKKDDEGYRVMRKLSAPRKPTKNNPKTWWEPEDVPKDFETLYSYCKSDVGAEASLNGKLKDLSRQEYKVWALDQEINSRGVFLDFEAVKGSIKIIEEYRNRLLPRVAELSDNAFETVDQLLEMKRWLLDRFGIDMPSLAAELIDEMLENEDLPEDAREMLKLRRILSKSSTKKLYAMLGSICEDGRVKDLLMYHGASTGRWCMPGDAEVFTAEFGWRTLKSLAATTNKKRRSILVFDPNTSDLSFQPSRVNKFESPEQLYTLENPLVSGCFTEEHKLPGLTSRKNFTVKSAGENPRMDMLVSGYLRGHWFGTPGVYFGERQTRVLLMAQADGHFIENTRNGRGLRFRFKKERKIARCTYLLDNAEIPFKKKKDKDGVTIIWVRFADFPVWLGSWCKKSDYKWVSGCTPEVFCDELKFWDSHAPLDTSFEFSTTEKANAEWAQTMGHMCGWFVRIVERPVETRPRHWGLSYRVYFKRAHTVRISQKDWQVQNAPTKDGFVYCPETPTGFFLVRYNGTVYITGNSGKGIQIQNFPRRKVDDLDQKMHCLATGDLDRILFLYGDPMDMVSSCLRGMIVAEPGNCLYVADYAAIEARGVCWLAGQEDSLQLFRQDKDAYKVMASSIYGGKPISQITGDERQLGKQAVLGCLAEDTLVYSDTGIKYIQDITVEDKIWNGRKYVKHDGIKATGERYVMTIGHLNLSATPDHLILSNQGWLPFAEIVSEGGTRLPKSGKFSDGGRLLVESSKRGLNAMSPCAALAAISKALESTNCGEEKLQAVLSALNPEMAGKGGTPAFIQTLSLIHDLEQGGEHAGETLKSVAKTQMTRTTKTMVLEVYESPSNLVEHSWNTLLRWMGTILGNSHSIELIRTKDMNREISVWQVMQRKTGIVVAPCYDIINVEDGGYFQAGNVIAHNCGYGMGAPKFQLTCQGYGMAVDEALAEKAVTTYRDTNDMVVKMWYNQERAAKLALTSKKVIKCGRVRWGYARGFLYCRLPSGRCLAYPAPKIIMGDTPWGEKREQLSYMSMNSKNQWVRTRTYGGKIVENITQATCRDVMAEAMLRLKAAGYPILFTVHDEIVCETPDAFGSVDEFIALLTEVPKWAKGFPIKAEGHKVYRYQKL